MMSCFRSAVRSSTRDRANRASLNRMERRFSLHQKGFSAISTRASKSPFFLWEKIRFTCDKACLLSAGSGNRDENWRPTRVSSPLAIFLAASLAKTMECPPSIKRVGMGIASNNLPKVTFLIFRKSKLPDVVTSRVKTLSRSIVCVASGDTRQDAGFGKKLVTFSRCASALVVH